MLRDHETDPVVLPPDVIGTSALPPARSLAPDCAWTLLGLIQRAFYVEGRDVTLASVLVELAEQAGIPRIEFAGAFDRAEQHA